MEGEREGKEQRGKAREKGAARRVAQSLGTINSGEHDQPKAEQVGREEEGCKGKTSVLQTWLFGTLYYCLLSGQATGMSPGNIRGP